MWIFLAECLRKFNETPTLRTSTLFMHGVPVLLFRYGTYVCNNNRQTSDPSDWWPFGPVTSNPQCHIHNYFHLCFFQPVQSRNISAYTGILWRYVSIQNCSCKVIITVVRILYVLYTQTCLNQCAFSKHDILWSWCYFCYYLHPRYHFCWHLSCRDLHCSRTDNVWHWDTIPLPS